MGYLFELIPVTITERIEGKSKAVSISNSIKIVQNLLSLKKTTHVKLLISYGMYIALFIKKNEKISK